MHFFDRTLYLQICIWKQGFSLGKDERYRLTFDWRFSALSQSEIRVHWWTRNSKTPTNLGRREFNSTLHQSSHGFATRVHGFATKTKALTHEIPPATQATRVGLRILPVSLRIDDFCTTTPLDCVTCSLRMPLWALAGVSRKSTTLQSRSHSPRAFWSAPRHGALNNQLARSQSPRVFFF